MMGRWLRWEAALRAVTLTPAEIYGVADRYGSIEPGNSSSWSATERSIRTGRRPTGAKAAAGPEVRSAERPTTSGVCGEAAGQAPHRAGPLS